MSWTDRRIELLKTMWADGLSGSQISAALGHGISRCAVLGKVIRLGLPKREKAMMPKPEKQLKRARILLVPRAAVRVDEPEPLGPPQTITPGCQFIHGDIDTTTWRMCAHPKENGPWCGYHAAVVYVKPREAANG